MKKKRSSGLLLPVSCLPSPFGIGDLGPEAYRFADFLHATRQHLWQILPLNPTHAASLHSPYQSVSAFAANPLLISPELLAADGLLNEADLAEAPAFPSGRVDYPAAEHFKTRLLGRAFERFQRQAPDQAFARFCDGNAHWLDNFAHFTAFRTHFDDIEWRRWPRDIRNRQQRARQRLAAQLAPEIERVKFLQFVFAAQWQRLKAYCNRKNVHILGDVPIYVPHDSADVWACPELFNLDRHHRPLTVSGVPPDYFSATGQLWGHPVYRWDVHCHTGFAWWLQRIAHNLDLFDYLRLDHFRGLVAYWEVPSGEDTAVNGRWVEVPAVDFFDALNRRFASLPLIAEDLGEISADVRETMGRYGFSGMRVLVFGFSGNPATNPNAPHNIGENCVVYTGTHDTNTVKGWLREELRRGDRIRLFRYLGRRIRADALPLEMVRLAMMSPAWLAVLPLQDLLGLGAESRVNRPGSVTGNWLWRLTSEQFAALPGKLLREMTEIYGRA